MLARWLQRQWFLQRRPAPALWLLLPLNWLFVCLAWLNRRRRPDAKLPVPVVVVGNITVGGAGKTPLTLWLARQLQARGWRPGIVSRGYGGQGGGPRQVDAASNPAEVGDEPVLIARRAVCPVWVGRRRAEAGRALLAAHPEVDILLCDDGLQHYRLQRDVELAVFDGRGAGNGWRLPIGPLREPLSRLATVNAIICQNLKTPFPVETPCFEMVLQAGKFYRLGDPKITSDACALAGKRLFALAGIGDPGRFFRTLEELGLRVEAHPFPDHHVYSSSDLAFAREGVLLMTEKDAVKCGGLQAGETWVLPVEAELSPVLIDLIVEKILGRQAA